MIKRITLFSLTLMIIGFGGGYVLNSELFSFLFFHLGGFGSLSLLASAGGFIASKKGYGYLLTFSLALCISILLGVVGAYLVPPTGEEGRPAACGGSISLVVLLLVILILPFYRRKDLAQS